MWVPLLSSCPLAKIAKILANRRSVLIFLVSNFYVYFTCGYPMTFFGTNSTCLSVCVLCTGPCVWVAGATVDPLGLGAKRTSTVPAQCIIPFQLTRTKARKTCHSERYAPCNETKILSSTTRGVKNWGLRFCANM